MVRKILTSPGGGRILWKALAAALVLGACSGGVDRGQSQVRASSSTTASAAPGSSGGDLSSFSGRIAFDNFEDVWTIDADGTDLTRLTRAPYPEFDPSWSPDGMEIAFRSERSGEPEIWIMNADGTGQRRLTEGLSPAWSPDGSLIAFSGRARLSVIRPDGTGRRVLPGTEGGEYPSWSPDGSRIAFNSNLTGDHVMYIAQADGSKVVDLSRCRRGLAGGLVARRPFDPVHVAPRLSGQLHGRVCDAPRWLGRPPVDAQPRIYAGLVARGRSYRVLGAGPRSSWTPTAATLRMLPTPGVGETSLADWTD